MKRLLALFTVCILLAGVICIPASAESTASLVDLLCTVNSDGDCLVTMTVTLHLEASHDKLTFPLPVEARNISMNGSAVSSTKTDSAINVDISKITSGYVGDASLRFEYTIPEAVKVVIEDSNSTSGSKKGSERDIQLTIPLLCGFEYPVEKLNFTITMPSNTAGLTPEFISIYRQTSIDSDLNVTKNGTQIIGSSKTVLNDHEGITMTMIVPKTMFPSVSTYVREGNPEIVPMAICAVLALLYWLFFLRTLPMFRVHTSTPPEGITAGEMGCRLTMAGGDLTMMVFTWAQLGYILIQMDGNGRVLLHKRMDMGNERSQFENKVFKLLFGARRMVDGTGHQYAKLCQKVAAQIPNSRSMLKGSSGNMKIFRGIACGSQVFCGVCVAMNMTTITVLQILMAMILAVFGAVSAWLIQDVAYRTHLRGKIPVYIGLVCILIWIVLGLLCGQVWIPLCCTLGEFLFGYFAAYGGRRSDLGRYNGGMVLGLRHYLKHLPRSDINRLLMNDPDYFFNLAPYALALGVIHPFANAFGRRKLDQCPYLMTRVHGKRTAEEWGQLMADVADMMDAKVRRMQIEKWTAVQIRVRRK